MDDSKFDAKDGKLVIEGKSSFNIPTVQHILYALKGESTGKLEAITYEKSLKTLGFLEYLGAENDEIKELSTNLSDIKNNITSIENKKKDEAKDIAEKWYNKISYRFMGKTDDEYINEQKNNLLSKDEQYTQYCSELDELAKRFDDIVSGMPKEITVNGGHVKIGDINKT
ncbi:MAG: hypothetical protein ABIG84_01455, partial [archaeon]